MASDDLSAPRDFSALNTLPALSGIRKDDPTFADRVGPDQLAHIGQVEGSIVHDDPGFFRNITGRLLTSPREVLLDTPMKAWAEVGSSVMAQFADTGESMDLAAGDIGKAFASGKAETARHTLRVVEIQGGPAAAEAAQKADAMQAEEQANPYHGLFDEESGVSGFLKQAPGKVAGVVGGMAENSPAILGLAALGAGIGAATPMPGGMLMGAKVGLTIGMGSHMAYGSAGAFYEQVKDLPGVDRESARGAALVLGFVNGSIGVLPIAGALTETGLVQRFAAGVGGAALMRRLLASPTGAAALGRVAVAFAGGEASQGLIGALMEVNTLIAEQFVSSGGLPVDPSRIPQAALAGAQIGLPISAMEVAGMPARSQAVREQLRNATRTYAQFENIGKMVEGVTEYQKNRVKAKDFADRVAEAIGQKSVSFRKGDLMDFFSREHMMTEDVESTLPDVVKQLKAAVNDPEASIRVSSGDVAAHLAPRKAFKVLRDNMRSGNNMTLAEIQKLVDQAKKAELPPAPVIDPASKAVFDDVRGQLKDRPEVADHLAAVYTAHLASLSEASGAKVQDIHAADGPVILKKLAAQLDERSLGIPGENVGDSAKYNIKDTRAKVAPEDEVGTKQLATLRENVKAKLGLDDTKDSKGLPTLWKKGTYGELFQLQTIMAGNSNNAATVLSRLGYHGLTNGTRNFVWHPDVMLPNKDPLSVVRGATKFEPGKRPTIGFTPDANLGTVFHEMGHAMLHQWEKYSPETIEPIRKWMGGDREKFANGFVDYLGGKAPVPALARAFEKFKTFLTAEYGTASALGEPLPADVRAVMDRLVASKEAIKSAQEVLLMPMLSKGELGDKGAAMLEMAAASAAHELDRQQLSHINAEGIDAFEKMKQHVREELISTVPVHSLVSWLKTGERLDKGIQPLMPEVWKMPERDAEAHRKAAEGWAEYMERSYKHHLVPADEAATLYSDKEKLPHDPLLPQFPNMASVREMPESIQKKWFVEAGQGVKTDKFGAGGRVPVEGRMETEGSGGRVGPAEPILQLARDTRFSWRDMEDLGAKDWAALHPSLMGGDADPQMVAQTFGFRDVHSMLEGIDSVPDLDTHVSQVAADRMPGWSDPRQWVGERALVKLSESVPDFLLFELESLRNFENQAGKPGPVQWRPNPDNIKETIITMAHGSLKEVRWRELVPEDFLREYQRLGEEAAGQHSKGSEQSAAFFKQRQILEFYRWREARQVLEDASKFRAQALELRDNDALRTQLNRQSLDGDKKHPGLAAVDNALRAYGFRDDMPPADQQPLGRYVSDRVDAGGNIIEDPNLYGREFHPNVKKGLTVEELRHARDFLTSLVHDLKQQDEYQAGPTPKPLDALAAETSAHIRSHWPEIDRANRNRFFNKLAGFGDSLLAELVRSEGLMRTLDGDPHGFLNQTIFQPLVAAEGLKARYQQQLREAMRGIMSEVSPETRDLFVERSSLQVRDDLEHSPVTGNKVLVPRKWLTKGELLVLLMNYGTETNKRAARLGMGITDEEAMAAFHRDLTPEMLGFANKLWAVMTPVFEEVQKTFRASTGAELDKLGAIGFSIGKVDVTGGYWPIKFSKEAVVDSGRTQFGSKNFDVLSVEDSFIHRRIGTMGPLELSLPVMLGHLEAKIHWATMYRPLQEAAKLIRHPEFRRAISDTVGVEFNKTFEHLLTNIARDGMPAEPLGAWDRVQRGLMTRAGQAALGLNSLTAANQVIGLAPAYKELDAKHIAAASIDVITNWNKKFSAMESESNELHKIDIDLVHKQWKMLFPDVTVEPSVMQQIQNLGRGRLFRTAADVQDYLQTLGMSHIMGVQKVVNGITYEAAKRQAVSQRRPDPVAYADAIVRQVQGGSGLKDLPYVLAKPGLARATLMFYSYMSVMADQMIGMGMSLSAEKTKGTLVTVDNLRKTTAALVAFALVPSTLEMMMRRKDKDKPRDMGMTNFFMRAQVGMLLAKTVPVVGDVIGGAIVPDVPGGRAMGGPAAQLAGQVRQAEMQFVSWGKHPFDPAPIAAAASFLTATPVNHLYQGLNFAYNFSRGKYRDLPTAAAVYVRGEKKEGFRK